VGLWESSPLLSVALVGPLVAISLYQRSAYRERESARLALERFAEVRSLKDTIERRSAEERREREIASDRRRRALELHDGVVQGLVTAQLAHDLGHEAQSHAAVLETLERAKGIVRRALEDEVTSTGLSTSELSQRSASGQAVDEAAKNGGHDGWSAF
jgi:signal transduction histidine kinase